MVNAEKVLITRPFYDDVTSYLSVWSEDIIDAAKNKGIDVIDLKREDANRNLLESRLKKDDPILVVFNGHGDNDKITGFKKNHVLIQADDNEHYLKSRIVYSRSCNSLKILGPKCVSKGTKSFIGFENGFALINNKNFSATPKKDPWAKHFLEATNLVPISLLKGNSVEESFIKAQNALQKSIDFFEAHYTKEHDEFTHIIPWLKYNKKIHNFLGDPDSRI